MGRSPGGPGYRLVTTQDQICDEINTGSGGPFGGSGGTTPNPPGEYDPCEGSSANVSARFERGTLLQLVPPPCDDNGLHVITNLEYLVETLGLTPPQSRYVQYHPGFDEQLLSYLNVNGATQEDKDYLVWAINYGISNPNMSISETGLLAVPFAENWGDPDDLVLFDPDNTVYQQYQDSQIWPNISRVIKFEHFVPMRYITLPNGRTRGINCLILAREQLAKAGYTASGYLPESQTFQIYKESTGVDHGKTKMAISYIIEALGKNIPVLIGIDNRVGTPSLTNEDLSTDHFVVIIAMVTDSKGKYFQFMDSATTSRIDGASYNNRLYYNPATGKISGKTMNGYGRNSGFYDYIITQVRKSIKL
jgi:hypothetical protein